MTKPEAAIIVGDPADPHVQAVAARMNPRGLTIMDATHLHTTVASVDLHRTSLVDVAGRTVTFGEATPARGWVRRLAPAAWDHGVRIGSHEAATLASRLMLLAAVLRDPAVLWLTPADALFSAENKIVQYRAATACGIRVPATLICAEPQRLAAELGEPFLVKPLGPGNFEHEGQQHVVYARTVRADELTDVDLLAAPFLAQRVIAARRHLRVVTVHGQGWVAELPHTDLPVDWRAHGPAHQAFLPSSAWPEVERAATHLAAALGVGFSSQDWVIDADGPVFLDLNPGGQWLFLPEKITSPVAAALADWLAGGD